MQQYISIGENQAKILEITKLLIFPTRCLLSTYVQCALQLAHGCSMIKLLLFIGLELHLRTTD